jgi:hypothetical protein
MPKESPKVTVRDYLVAKRRTILRDIAALSPAAAKLVEKLNEAEREFESAMREIIPSRIRFGWCPTAAVAIMALLREEERAMTVDEIVVEIIDGGYRPLDPTNASNIRQVFRYYERMQNSPKKHRKRLGDLENLRRVEDLYGLKAWSDDKFN